MIEQERFETEVNELKSEKLQTLVRDINQAGDKADVDMVDAALIEMLYQITGSNAVYEWVNGSELARMLFIAKYKVNPEMSVAQIYEYLQAYEVSTMKGKKIGNERRGITKITLQQILREGKIPYIERLGVRYVRKSDLDVFIDKRGYVRVSEKR